MALGIYYHLDADRERSPIPPEQTWLASVLNSQAAAAAYQGQRRRAKAPEVR